MAVPEELSAMGWALPPEESGRGCGKAWERTANRRITDLNAFIDVVDAERILSSKCGRTIKNTGRE